MKKVVINICHGGFGLSSKAIAKYLGLKGKEAFFYVQTKYNHRDGKEEYTKIMEDDERYLCRHIITKDFGDSYPSLDTKEMDDYYFSEYDIKRDDPDLVAVVEELREDSFGSFSELKVVEIPDDIEYTIEEYDGMEWIAENHRTWQ